MRSSLLTKAEHRCISFLFALLCAISANTFGQNSIIAAEYFFDSDPGPGKGTSISVTSSASINVTQSASIATLSKGQHTLFARMKNQFGVWSVSVGEKFLVTDSIKGNVITQAEYFFDVDPGEGKAALIPLARSTARQEATTTNVSVSGLSIAIHRMFVRLRDDKNRWGNPVGAQFLATKGTYISRAEYFVDTLGTRGFGRPMAALDSLFNGSLEYAVALIDTSIAKEGKYKIYMRVRDSDGRWSTTARDSIFFDKGLNPFVVTYGVTSIAFGNVRIGGVKDTLISISSSGKDTLKISNIISTNALFSVRVTTKNLPPGQSFQDTIRFAPTAGGSSSGILLVSTNASQTPDTIRVSGTGTSATGVNDLPSQIPKEYALAQNYPNPFNPATTISFGLPFKSFVTLKVFDVLGREVSILLSEELSPGTYTRQWNAASLPSGVYFYRLQAGSFTETKKLLLLR